MASSGSPLRFECPECGAETVVDPKVVGRTGPCVRCGKLVTVERSQLEMIESPQRTQFRVVLGAILYIAVLGVLGALAILVGMRLF